ncbi:MAG: hypothetical protein M2R45_04763 [Verrucomicrobia subdivision 3 bacterium]|nr:hypothetical protein [Limisphaerales bacterium]MCS1415092.1 hypothetical protein [Limisphaerales bacterium]
MNSFFDRYNLSAFERRLAVVVVMAVFLVINTVFVWPRFNEWGEIRVKIDRANQKLRTYQAQLTKGPALKKRLAELEDAGSDVIPAERANQLITVIQQKARDSKLPFPNIRPVRTRLADDGKEKFFEQKAYSLTVTTDPEELIAFLVAVGSDDSVIRVRDFDLKPEPPKNHRLICNMTLVANYQLQPSEDSGVKRKR